MIETLIEIAQSAGRAILEIYAGEIAAETKPDQSPVTEADRAAEAIILEGLKKLTPDLPVIAEEEVAAGRVPKIGARFWLVDPLDGTREFLNRNGEFTVNIALIENRRPVAGCVYAPAAGALYAGGTLAFRRPYGAEAAGVTPVGPKAGSTASGSQLH